MFIMAKPQLPNLSTLTREQIEDLVRDLFQRVVDLENRLAKDSHNSSKPPSSNGFSSRKRILPPVPGRKSGGQTGHDGTTLKMVAVPDRVVSHPLPKHCQCGKTLGRGVLTKERRQVYDLPQTRYEVTEHRVFEARCACGRQHQGQFPEGVPHSVQYGPNIKAAATYLTQYQLLPMKRTTQLLSDLYGLHLSPATVQASVALAANSLAPAVQSIADAIKTAPVAHFDETGQRTAGRLRWLHTAVTETLAWYGAHDKRGQTAMKDFGILSNFKGVAMHDGWRSYREFDCTHALCNAHHLRELIFLTETTDQAWPERMIDLLCQAKTEADLARGSPGSATVGSLSHKRLGYYRRRYQVLLRAGEQANPAAPGQGTRGRVKQSAATNLLGRLREHTDDVLRFIYDLRVPFDNNLAERAIRMPKLKEKVSGCFRTTFGADAFCVIRSYLATLHKQGLDLFQALVMTFQGQAPQPAL